ncbi:MAG: hypothetical protein V4494_06190 [Chlamydiota bacterium]
MSNITSNKEIQALSQAGTHDLYINRFNNKLESVSKDATFGRLWVNLVHINDTNRIVSRVENIIEKNQTITHDKNVSLGLERFKNSLTMSGKSGLAIRMVATYNRIINPPVAPPASAEEQKINHNYFNIFKGSLDRHLNDIKTMLKNPEKATIKELEQFIGDVYHRQEEYNDYAKKIGEPTRDLEAEINELIGEKNKEKIQEARKEHSAANLTPLKDFYFHIKDAFKKHRI